MPFATPRLRRRRLGLATLGAMLVAAATPALAAAACPVTPTTKAFGMFGDVADYSLASGGSFEDGTTGWALARASVVTGNESFNVRSSADSKSLSIRPDGLVASAWFCVGAEHPTFRFFARRTSGTWGTLNVIVRWTDANGVNRSITVGSLSGDAYTSWRPSPTMALSTVLPLWEPGQTLSTRLVFDPDGSGGDWAIDDVFIDPYSR